ncbi:MAG: sigma-70 family RNA polymerase sigma factor [Bacteroidetes bacterium]|nr:sigma-70 family RNA polymerase sigma factor [Bacteroidota bacterium]
MPNTAHNDHVLQTIATVTRAESGKLVSVLTRIFGPHNLVMAEDAVQDVLLKAIENWQEHGLPDNPRAWLYRATRNRAIDIVRKNRRQQTFATDINTLLDSEYTAATTLNDCFRETEIRDDQLRMMFACCHPSIGREGQIALILKTLSGLTVAQIARAFIVKPEAIEKRLYRARLAFRDNNATLEIPGGTALLQRLDNVLETIYLLFNEAHSTSYQDSLTRDDLAQDCIRLCSLLTEHVATSLPQTNALLALLCFHTARLASRVDKQGDLQLMQYQDRSLWDRELIEKGVWHLERAATGENISRYHIEAAIAYEHCKAASYEETDWRSILYYYDLLTRLMPTPVVLLNRAIAVKELEGPQAALDEIKKIPGIDFLQNYYLLHAILGELLSQTGKKESAISHYEKAMQMAVSSAERKFIQQKLNDAKK